MLKKIAIFSLLTLLLGSCIKEITEDCGDGLRLHFRFTYNEQGSNQLTDKVGDIRVYVFDGETGLLAAIVPVDAEDIARGYKDVPLPDGFYDLVAWGGSGGDLGQGGYLDAAMSDPATLTYSAPVTIGTTTIDQFRMMLGCDEFAGSGPGEVIPTIEQFGDLFFASAADVEASQNIRRVVNFDFIRNTSVLKITVTGLRHLTGHTAPAGRAIASNQPLGVFVTGCNGIYGSNNRIDTYAPPVRYEPHYTTLTADVMEVDVKVQRMELGRHTLHPLMLYAYSPLTGEDMIWPLNVIEAILSIRDAKNNYMYASQEDIDRQYEFPIEISILHDLSVKVSIQGFEIVNVTPEIERP